MNTQICGKKVCVYVIILMMHIRGIMETFFIHKEKLDVDFIRKQTQIARFFFHMQICGNPFLEFNMPLFSAISVQEDI